MNLSKDSAKVTLYVLRLTLAFFVVSLLSLPAASGQGVVSTQSTHKVIGEYGAATW